MKTLREILKEGNVSAGIGVRGLGDITGNPATTENSENSHIDRVVQGAEINNKSVQDFINSHNTTNVLQEPDDNWWSKAGARGTALTAMGKPAKTVSKIIQEAQDIEEETSVAGIAGTGDERLPADQREPGVTPKTKYKRKNELESPVLGKILRRRMLDTLK